MQMLLQELEVWYVIPALRRALALELRKRGIKAVEIAEKLGVTKAAVSQYFSKTRAVDFTFDKKMQNEIIYAVDNILQGVNSNQELQRLIIGLRESRAICKFHRLQEKNIDRRCEVCFVK
jgi:predicted transcriptional regulator